MGLNIMSEDGEMDIFSRSYSTFMEFRCIIFSLVTNMPYKKVIHYMRNGGYISKMVPYFDKFPKLQPFMDHSDCDGSWTIKECSQVKNLLESVIRKTKPLNRYWNSYQSIHETIQNFVEGLNYCIEKGYRAEFM